MLGSFADFFAVMLQKELFAKHARQATEFGVGLLEATSEALLMLDSKGLLVYGNHVAKCAPGIEVEPEGKPQPVRQVLEQAGLGAETLELIDEYAALGCDADQLVELPGSQDTPRTFRPLGSQLPLATGAAG